MLKIWRLGDLQKKIYKSHHVTVQMLTKMTSHSKQSYQNKLNYLNTYLQFIQLIQYISFFFKSPSLKISSTLAALIYFFVPNLLISRSPAHWQLVYVFFFQISKSPKLHKSATCNCHSSIISCNFEVKLAFNH